MSNKTNYKKLTVIGTGLIGGSFLMACRENFPALKIRAVDKDSDTLQFLVKNKLADDVSLALPETFEADELVVLASHLKSSLEILKAIAPAIKLADAQLTDIGSCKVPICNLADELLPDNFIGGHPLAGKEFSGVTNASSLLFAGKAYALCHPDAYGDNKQVQQQFQQLQDFISDGLRANVGIIQRDRHDQYMAYVSHFPQLYAVMLTTLLHRNEPGHLLAFHGAGIDGQLRLAASPYEMWRDVFEFNEDNLRQVLREFGGLFQEADSILNTPPMATWFDHANEIHKEFHDFRLNT